MAYRRRSTRSKFNLVTNNFLANGGDMDNVLKRADHVFPTGPPLDVAIQSYFSFFSPVSARTDGRISTNYPSR